MKIEFDTENATELMAVAALIEVLAGDRAPLTTERHPLETVPAAASPIAVDAQGTVTIPTPPVPAAPNHGGLMVAVTTPPPPPTDVDKNGLPWDNRIHSTPAKQNADGSWRSKRNLDPDVEAAVVAELRRAMAAPLPVVASPTPAPVAADPTPAPPAPEPTPVDAATAFGGAAATAAPNPAPTPPTPAPAAPIPAGETDFPGMMRVVTELQRDGRLTVEETAQICQGLQLTGLRDFLARPDLIPSFMALLPAA